MWMAHKTPYRRVSIEDTFFPRLAAVHRVLGLGFPGRLEAVLAKTRIWGRQSGQGQPFPEAVTERTLWDG